MSRFVVLLLFIGYASAQGPTVTIPQVGTVEGFTEQSLNGRTFNAFTGVPYAQPPVGNLRFEAPLPAEPWEGTIVANISRPCLQLSQFTRKFSPIGHYSVLGEEDCLYLNIYTPTLNSSANLDVIMYIHPGAFMWGQGDFHGPRFLLNKDVVFITFNYRLGPLGFLSTENDVVPGNNGLKDQILALEWVKQNIEYFGGNPGSVTLAGSSSGGAMVQFHFMSPKSWGLFDRGFTQSGTTLSPWFLVEKAMDKTRTIASVVGCDHLLVTDLVTCLKEKPGEDVVNASRALLAFFYNPVVPLGPVPDFLWASDPVLPGNPYDLLKSGAISRAPFLTSHTEDEGIYIIFDYYTDPRLQEVNTNWNSNVGPALMLDQFTTLTVNLVNDRIREHYFGNGEITQTNIQPLIRATSDRDIKDGLYQTLQLQSVYSDVYVYGFNYSATSPWYLPATGVKLGVAHIEDIFFCFDNVALQNVETDPNDLAVVDLFVDVIVEFAKTGVPKVNSVDWPTSNKENDFSLLWIDSATELSIRPIDYTERGFFDSLLLIENSRFSALDFPILYGP